MQPTLMVGTLAVRGLICSLTPMINARLYLSGIRKGVPKVVQWLHMMAAAPGGGKKYVPWPKDCNIIGYKYIYSGKNDKFIDLTSSTHLMHL